MVSAKGRTVKILLVPLQEFGQLTLRMTELKPGKDLLIRYESHAASVFSPFLYQVSTCFFACLLDILHWFVDVDDHGHYRQAKHGCAQGFDPHRHRFDHPRLDHWF